MQTSSKTPLIKKLGIKASFKIKVINAPENYFELLGDLPDGVLKAEKELNFVHIFSKDFEEVEMLINKYKNKIVPNGMIWVSWLKGKKTSLNEDIIRDIAIHTGLVDIKVCAVDNNWSGLKLVIPLKSR